MTHVVETTTLTPQADGSDDSSSQRKVCKRRNIAVAVCVAAVWCASSRTRGTVSRLPSTICCAVAPSRAAMQINEYYVLKQLGEGAFAVVVLAKKDDPDNPLFVRLALMRAVALPSAAVAKAGCAALLPSRPLKSSTKRA
jgi:hypothetical protein